jgi:hypothetical protein
VTTINLKVLKETRFFLTKLSGYKFLQKGFAILNVIS